MILNIYLSFFQYCQAAQNQPKSHFLFHKNVSLRDFYTYSDFDYRFPLIGIGFHLNDAIRVITFVVVLIMKIKKSDNQNEETKKTLKIVGSIIFLLIGAFGLVKILSWIGDYAVLGKQISYLAGAFCFGNVVPTIIIRRNPKMSEYFIKSTKEKMYYIKIS